LTDIVLAVPIGAASFQRATEAVSEEVAARDGIEPPTGEALCRVLSGMHTIPDEGIEAQVVRW